MQKTRLKWLDYIGFLAAGSRSGHQLHTEAAASCEGQVHDLLICRLILIHIYLRVLRSNC